MNKKSHMGRPFKGNSLIEFPASFTVVDIETTGFNPKYDEIIELSAIKIIDGHTRDSYESLIKPSTPIDEFIEDLTGISNEMVENAPDISGALPEFLAFVGNSTVLGQNVNFDINFIYDNSMRISGKPFTNDFVDLLRISKRAFPELPDHRLCTVAQALEIAAAGMHRGQKDCEITYSCFEKCKNILSDRYGNIQNFCNFCATSHRGILAKAISASTVEFDEDHPLFNKFCVFTGTLSQMLRKEAMQAVADVGGKCEDRITQETNFLIVGSFEYTASVKGNKSSKIKKAENYILRGQDLKIISEDTFYDLLANQ
jgi:DNA polymerase III subunit epsilon